MPPEMVDELDRLCDIKEQLTGQHTNRTDVIREALRQYLDAMKTGPSVRTKGRNTSNHQ